MGNVLHAIAKRKVLLILLVIALCTGFFGYYNWSSSKDIVAAYERKLADVSNAISTVNSSEHNITYTTKHIDYGVNVDRWQKKDDRIALEFISPAFSFMNADEYIEHRNKYVEVLGENSTFVTEFMPEYVPDFTNMSIGTNAEPDDGTHMMSKIKKFKSYVAAIDEKTGVYSYVVVLDCDVHIPYANYKGCLNSAHSTSTKPVQNTVLITYNISEEGKISDLYVAMVEQID